MTELADRPPRLHARVRRGMRDQEQWRALMRFAAVGASGYLVNLAVFAACIGPLDLNHRPAAVMAFLVAVSNNFHWNRTWTFRARDTGRITLQARRFFLVSLIAFAANLIVLEALIVWFDVPELLAQAIAIVAATPISFLANKLWTFGAAGPRG